MMASDRKFWTPLQKMVDAATLRLLAGGIRLSRGEKILSSNKISNLEQTQERITGNVQGQKLYATELFLKGQGLGGSCTCPDFDSAHFCKHWVALGCAVIQSTKPKCEKTFLETVLERKPKSKQQDAPHLPTVGYEEIRNYLLNCSREKLVESLMIQVDKDGDLARELKREIRNSLSIANASPNAPGIEMAILYREIESACDPGDSISWRECYEFSREIQRVFEKVKKLMEAQSHVSPEWVDLAEFFIACFEKALDSVDSSDGSMGELLETLPEFHLEICRKAKPDSKSLAARLFQWELHSGFGSFSGSVRRYRDLLGTEGIREFHALAAAEWEKVPPMLPRTARSEGEGYPHRFTITRMMLDLAEIANDVDQKVGVLSKELTYPWDYLKIAEVYNNAGRKREAVEWAERGLIEFPDRPDGRLKLFLADRYHEQGRFDEEMALVYSLFTASHSLANIQVVKKYADALQSWPMWRDRIWTRILNAVKRMRSKVDDAGSLIVEFLLWEESVEDAWKSAQEFGCSMHLWQRLAGLREAEFPADVIPIYQKLVGEIVDQGNNDAYRKGVTLLSKICGLMRRTGKEADFQGYLESVRRAYKPKRNFIKLLEARF